MRSLLPTSLAGLVLGPLGLCGPFTAPAVAADQIIVVDEVTDCEYEQRKLYRYTREGDEWVHGDIRIADTHIARLRELATAAKDDGPESLDSIGLTAEAITAHRADILRAVREWESYLHEVVPPEIEPLLGPDAVRAMVRRMLAPPEDDFGAATYRFEMTIPGDPVIRFRSISDRWFKGPLTVIVGDDGHDVSSIELSLALGKLADPEGPNHRLLCADTYFRDEFWKDHGVWHDHVAKPWVNLVAKTWCASLPGRAEFDKTFTIREQTIGSINSVPESLFVRIGATDGALKDGALIDAAWWWNPLEDGRPSSDWAAFLKIHASASAALAKLAWVANWKVVGEKRSVELHAVGPRGMAERQPDLFVDPPWKHSGFGGKAEFEILFREGDQAVATAYASPAGDGMVFTSARAGWPVKDAISYHPTDRWYATLDATGKSELREIEE